MAQIRHQEQPKSLEREPGGVTLPSRHPFLEKNRVVWIVGAILCIALVLLGISALSGMSGGSMAGKPAADESAKEPLSAGVDASTSDGHATEEANGADDPLRVEREALSAKLNEDVAGIASTAGMQVGACVIDLQTGAVAGYQSDTAMVSASMIKLIVAAAFCEQVEAGVFGLDDYETLHDEDIVGGTGVLAGRGSGAQVTYRELIQKMLSVSDNTATNALIRNLGMDAVNAEATNLGLTGTKLNRFMMDEVAIANGIENYTSAQDVARLLEMVYRRTLVSPDASELILQALEQQEDWGGVLNGLPEGVPFAHKTGSLSNARHDGGIVLGERPFVLVVLCGGEGFYEQGAHDVMARLASAVYEDIILSA